MSLLRLREKKKQKQKKRQGDPQRRGWGFRTDCDFVMNRPSGSNSVFMHTKSGWRQSCSDSTLTRVSLARM